MNTGSIVGISAGVLVALLGGSAVLGKAWKKTREAREAKKAREVAPPSPRALAAVRTAQERKARRIVKDMVKAQKEFTDAMDLTRKNVKVKMTQKEKDVLKAAKKAVDATISAGNQLLEYPNLDLHNNFTKLYDLAVQEIQQVNNRDQVNELVEQLKTKLEELLKQQRISKEEVKQLKQGLITIMKNRKKVRV